MKYLNSINSELKNAVNPPERNIVLNSVCGNAYIELFEFLVKDIKIDTNQIAGVYKRNCFLVAATKKSRCHRRKEFLRYLNNHNPDLKNGRDSRDNTAYDLAKKSNCDEIVTYLSDPSTNLRKSVEDATKNGDIKELRRLHSENAFALTESGGGSTLMIAAMYADKETVKFLIEEAGMNENVTCSWGMNALIWSLMAVHLSPDKEYNDKDKFNRIETSTYLYSNYPHLLSDYIKSAKSSESEFLTAICEESDYKETVAFLLEEAEFDANSKNNKGENCFILAAKLGHVKTLKYLYFKYPALKSSVDRRGKTAKEIAVENNQQKIVDFLERPVMSSLMNYLESALE